MQINEFQNVFIGNNSIKFQIMIYTATRFQKLNFTSISQIQGIQTQLPGRIDRSGGYGWTAKYNAKHLLSGNFHPRGFIYVSNTLLTVKSIGN